MDNKELKVIWKLSKILWLAGFIFWLLETAVFLIIEGWHYKATNPIEIFCDKIVINALTTALFLTTYVCFNLLINFTKKNNYG